MDEHEMPISSHLNELRRRLIWILIAFVLFVVISFIFAGDIFTWIRQDSLRDVQIHTLSPSDSLKIYVQISFISSLIFTMPVILYHLWQFVRPGLKPNEQRIALLYVPIAMGLFLCGLLFGYYVIFPYLIQFSASLNKELGAVEMYGIYQYFSFMLNVILPLGLFFELPVVVLFLTRIRLLTPQFLHKWRRVAYLVLVIVAAMITPPDLISNILVSIPLILLYEISVWICSWLYRKQIREAQKEDL